MKRAILTETVVSDGEWAASKVAELCRSFEAAGESYQDVMFGIRLNSILKDAGLTTRYLCEMSPTHLLEYLSLVQAIHAERGI